MNLGVFLEVRPRLADALSWVSSSSSGSRGELLAELELSPVRARGG